MAHIKIEHKLRFNFLRIFVLVFSIFIYGCENQRVTLVQGISPAYNENVVVAFFDEAEAQMETDDQRQILMRALDDMLRLSPNELRNKRYANYQLEPGKWTLAEVLTHYYYARTPIEFPELLIDDISSKNSKQAIKKALIHLQQTKQTQN